MVSPNLEPIFMITEALRKHYSKEEVCAIAHETSRELNERAERLMPEMANNEVVKEAFAQLPQNRICQQNAFSGALGLLKEEYWRVDDGLTTPTPVATSL